VVVEVDLRVIFRAGAKMVVQRGGELGAQRGARRRLHQSFEDC
jgi:hypothetical protein